MYDYTERFAAKYGEVPLIELLWGVPGIAIFIVAFAITGDAILAGVAGFFGGLLPMVGLMGGAKGGASAPPDEEPQVGDSAD